MKSKNNFVLWIALCLLGTITIQAQNPSEILNYSTQNNFGSARIMGVSGAMNSIGADMGLITQNPASIGAFWKSEFSVTGAMSTSQSESRFVNGGQGLSSSSKTAFLLPQMGYVYTNTDLDRNLMAYSFGLGYNKTSSLNSESSFSGYNSGSITEYWLASADGFSPNELYDFQEGLAYDAEVLYEDGVNYYTDYLGYEDLPLNKEGFENVKGKTDEIYMSFGGNFNNKILFGATLGIPIYNYERTLDYREINDNTDIPKFVSLSYRETLSQQGAGVNLKLGAIAKLNNNIRLSGAIHSPTYYVTQEQYYTDLSYTYFEDEQTGTSSARSPFLDNEYAVITPWRVLGGIGLILGKSGFIDAEIDFIDYSSGKFDLTFDDFDNSDVENENVLNNEINLTYGSAVNFKLGGEYAIESFRLRGGLRFDGTPEVDNDEFNKSFSLGVGYRGDNFYIDAALVTRNASKSQRLYPFQPSDLPQNEPLIDQEIRTSNFAITVGFKL